MKIHKNEEFFHNKGALGEKAELTPALMLIILIFGYNNCDQVLFII